MSDCGCDWRWEIRRDYFVLVNPSGGDQVRVSRRNLGFRSATVLAKHEANWGGLTEVSRQVSGAEATELLPLLRPFGAPIRKKA